MIQRIKKFFTRGYSNRAVRRPFGINLVADRPTNNLTFDRACRARGYTGGDTVVVLMHSDYQRLCALARSKCTNPVTALTNDILHTGFLRTLTPAPTDAESP